MNPIQKQTFTMLENMVDKCKTTLDLFNDLDLSPKECASLMSEISQAQDAISLVRRELLSVR